MLAILLVTYLIIGAFASALIWTILIASKRRNNKGISVKRRRSESNLFTGTNTKSSRFRP